VSVHLVWDFGGVLFRWRPDALLARVWPQRVADDASAAHWRAVVFQGYVGDWLEFDRGVLDADALVARIAARTGLADAELRALIDAVPDELAPLPDSVALVERARAAGRRQFFLSNMPAPYADHLERTHEFVRAFDAGVFSSRVRLVKPDPAIFALAARRFGAQPSRLVFIDDHPGNVDAARAAGWQAVQFVDAASCAAELERLGAF
jgi:putative hydrolase of the HAD superfamily